MGLEKFIAVIVLYKSTLNDCETFKSILKAVGAFHTQLELLVYNNSPLYWSYQTEVYEYLNITYINDDHNSGVSRAYNVAFNYAKKMSKKYIILFDQDTKLPPSFFTSLLKSQQDYCIENVDLFCPIINSSSGIISPGKPFFFSSKKLSFITAGIYELKKLTVINSGLVISIKLFELTGGYNEKIKLDFSDFDFLKRSMKFCNRIIVFNAECRHSLSSEGSSTKDAALNRFNYYILGAKFFHKSKLESLVLKLWISLRSLKLNYKYKTLDFTRRLLNNQ